MQHQFSSGMKVPVCPKFSTRLVLCFCFNIFECVLQTVAVIPVSPHGVVQLGSSLSVIFVVFNLKVML